MVVGTGTPDPSPVQVLRLTESDLRGDDWAGTIDALTAAGTTRVAADLSRVEHLSSLGFGRLVWTLKNLRDAGGDLRLFGVTRRGRALLDGLGLQDLFRRYATEAEAVASFDAET